jgi:hypothetical protein
MAKDSRKKDRPVKADQAIEDPPVMAADAAVQQPMLPMFYRAPRPLDMERHKDKALVARRTFTFAAKSNSVPITVDEIAVCARHYPFVFTDSNPAVPVAVLGLRQGENLMVDEDGVWDRSTYIPGYVRRYPFIFLERQTANQFALCIDEESGLIENGGGSRALFSDGQPSEITRRALSFCSAYHRQFMATKDFVKAMTDTALLNEKVAQVSIGDGQRVALQGLRVIDELRLKELADKEFLALRRRGYLSAVYCQLMSQNNWSALARRMSARIPASA